MKELNLTYSEETVLNCIIQELYAEPGFSDVEANDVAQLTGINIKSVRGVLASLIKKEIVTVQDMGLGYNIIYLNEQYYYLHPTWSEE